jgi:DNA polymerase II small subunit
MDNFKKIIDDASDEGLFVLNKEYIIEWKRDQANLVPQEKQKEKIEIPAKMVEVQKTNYIYAKEVSADIKIRHELDVTNRINTKGKVSEFKDYFNERFKTLSAILMKHAGMNLIASKDLKRINKNEEFVIIGMLLEKGVTKNGNVMLRFDDDYGTFNVVVTQKDPVVFDVAKNIVNDDVVAIRGIKLGENIMIGNNIEYPDLPHRSYKKIDSELYAIAISDMHIGSKIFHETEFQRFIDWLSMKNVTEAEKRLWAK